MIWNSIVVMTVIDLIVILLTVAVLWNIYKNRQMLRQLHLYYGSLLILTGLIFIVMFYVADISIMHILPVFIHEEDAMSAMSNLHLGYNWIVTSVGIGLIIASILYSNMVLFPQIMHLEDELKEHASTDSLTKAYNRLKFDEIIESEINRSKRYDQMLSLIAFDIDHFKTVNDNYGHLFGDYVLKTIVNLTKDNIRGVDYLARWGGEEFMIILPETGLERAEALAQRIKEEIENYKFKKIVKVTVSFGVAQFKKDDSEDTLIKRADDALYKAKNKGRNRVEIGRNRVEIGV
jgi:diguanylate cyclase (GGDEF)-like protein